MDNQELLKIALEASALAESEILKIYTSDYSVEWKPDSTPVTIADKKAEEVMREFFQKETPGFGIIGEEFGIESQEAEYQWILDPIDGTKSFIHGVPLFGTLIALYKKGKPLVSIIRLPALHSTLYASEGAGAFLDGNQIFAYKETELSKALVLSGTLNTMEDKGYGKPFESLRRSARLYRGWGDCYGYYLVAAGRADIMIDPVVSLWDIAPFPLIFKETGGFFGTFSGETKLFDEFGKPLASIYEGYTGFASSKFLADEVISRFSKIG